MPVPDRCAGKGPRATVLSAVYAPEGISDDWRYRDTRSSWRRAGSRAVHGSDKWQRISWDDAFTRIAKLMKADRDANFIEKNEQGVTVNRWLSTGMLCASAASNETGMLTQKFARSLGMLAVDNQARV